MVYGELGRYPIEIDIELRIISYWTKLFNQRPVSMGNFVLQVRNLHNKTAFLYSKTFKYMIEYASYVTIET
jgi:hypothetical protein